MLRQCLGRAVVVIDGGLAEEEDEEEEEGKRMERQSAAFSLVSSPLFPFPPHPPPLPPPYPSSFRARSPFAPDGAAE